MNIESFKKTIKIIVYGHLLNPPWHSRAERRRTRGNATLKAVGCYLQKYVPFIASIKKEHTPTPGNDKCRIFSIWLQGEESAPAIVKSCLAGIRRNCSQELIVLDEESLKSYINLPGYIEDKYKAGKIRPAHYADICRVELLYQYGGIWMDATCYATSSVPDMILDIDFFIYLGGENIYGGYAFVQNCFFRSKQYNFLCKAWRDTIFEYWRNEDSPADYFVHQILFKMVVENNKEARELFEKMPKLVQDPTHSLWPHKDEKFEKATFEKLCIGAFFQKTEYKSKSALKPIPGSIADHIINGNN